MVERVTIGVRGDTWVRFKQSRIFPKYLTTDDAKVLWMIEQLEK